MKKSVLIICLGLSFLVNALLCNYIAKRQPVCERRHLEDINRTGNLIPDEETAKKIAEVIIDADENWVWDEGYTYYADVKFDEESYEWVVSYYPKLPPGAIMLDGEKIVWIRKDNGLIEKVCW